MGKYQSSKLVFTNFISSILASVYTTSISIFLNKPINEVENYLYFYKITQFQVFVESNNIYNFILFLCYHSNYQFNLLADIVVVDFPNRVRRFEVNYSLLSIKLNIRIQVQISLRDFSPIPSVSSIFLSAVWIEREIWDMYGIYFFNHPDLRRILTDYNFEGFPLRKDFPLSGFVELQYDDINKKVVYGFLEVAQEFRFFSFSSPWQKYNLINP